MRPRWSRRVRRDLIRRLYEMDARGIHDDELLDQVGYALLARCEDMIEVTRAAGGEVLCPSCRQAIRHPVEDDHLLACAGCGWRIKWRDFRKTFRNKKLQGREALGPLTEFVEVFPRSRSYSQKIIAIDRLIHTFHAQLRKWPTAPIAKSLLEGTVKEVVEFLDALTYGQHTTPELHEMRQSYRDTLARSWIGGCPQPKDSREPYQEHDTQADTSLDRVGSGTTIEDN